MSRSFWEGAKWRGHSRGNTRLNKGVGAIFSSFSYVPGGQTICRKRTTERPASREQVGLQTPDQWAAPLEVHTKLTERFYPHDLQKVLSGTQTCEHNLQDSHTPASRGHRPGGPHAPPVIHKFSDKTRKVELPKARLCSLVKACMVPSRRHNSSMRGIRNVFFILILTPVETEAVQWAGHSFAELLQSWELLSQQCTGWGKSSFSVVRMPITEFVLVLSFVKHCTIFLTNNCQPTFALRCTIF